MDRNGPKWTEITEMDIEMSNFFPGLSLGDILPFPGFEGFWPKYLPLFFPRDFVRFAVSSRTPPLWFTLPSRFVVFCCFVVRAINVYVTYFDVPIAWKMECIHLMIHDYQRGWTPHLIRSRDKLAGKDVMIREISHAHSLFSIRSTNITFSVSLIFHKKLRPPTCRHSLRKI